MKTTDEIRDQVIVSMANTCELMEETVDMKLYRELYEASISLEKAKKHLNAASILEGLCDD